MNNNILFCSVTYEHKNGEVHWTSVLYDESDMASAVAVVQPAEWQMIASGHPKVPRDALVWILKSYDAMPEDHGAGGLLIRAITLAADRAGAWIVGEVTPGASLAPDPLKRLLDIYRRRGFLDSRGAAMHRPPKKRQFQP